MLNIIDFLSLVLAVLGLIPKNFFLVLLFLFIKLVELWRIELQLSACKTEVIPLYYNPKVDDKSFRIKSTAAYATSSMLVAGVGIAPTEDAL